MAPAIYKTRDDPPNAPRDEPSVRRARNGSQGEVTVSLWRAVHAGVLSETVLAIEHPTSITSNNKRLPAPLVHGRGLTASRSVVLRACDPQASHSARCVGIHAGPGRGWCLLAALRGEGSVPREEADVGDDSKCGDRHPPCAPSWADSDSGAPGATAPTNRGNCVGVLGRYDVVAQLRQLL